MKDWFSSEWKEVPGAKERRVSLIQRNITKSSGLKTVLYSCIWMLAFHIVLLLLFSWSVMFDSL